MMTAPKIVMTYLIRNEADIIADGIAFHAAQGVDQFIVMDNLSTDGTRALLKELAEQYPLEYIFQPEDDYNQSGWVTMMAQKAATDYGADWVINSDADEFWIAPQQTLQQALAQVAEDVGVLQVQRHNAAVVCRNNVLPFSAQSNPMLSTVFETQSYNANGLPLPPKVIHRGRADVTVHQGNHGTSPAAGQITQQNTDIKILHFPYQSLAKYKSKILLGGAAYRRNTTLPETTGATWRTEYEKIVSGQLNTIWDAIPQGENDAYIGLQDGTLFEQTQVRDFVQQSRRQIARQRAEQAMADLVPDTRAAVSVVKEKLLAKLALKSGEVRTNSPLYNNMRFSLQGPQRQLEIAQTLTASSPEDLAARFAFLRDSYSLFPANQSFKTLIKALFNDVNGKASDLLAQDCTDRIVVLHITCSKYTDRAIASMNSFLGRTEGKYHHIIVKGQPGMEGEADVTMRISYDGLFLTVPVSDSYEALNRKVFYALMALDLAGMPKMVIKLDDDLHLEDMQAFDSLLAVISENGNPYCGRRVGASTHAEQWHGWHLDKCSAQAVETRGYTYPLPKSYAAGGYGYVLCSGAIKAAADMYLGMKEFFDMPAVGLEDAYIGHAMYAQNIELDDISDPQNVRSMPGLKIREP